MLERNQRKEILKTLYTMEQNLSVLLTSLIRKGDELSKLEDNETTEENQLISPERCLRIESLAYDIISNKDISFVDSVKRLTEDYFDEPNTERSII